MNKYSLETPFQEFRGKICSHSRIIYKKMYGTRYTSVVCNPYQGEGSAAQQAQRNRMRTAVAKIDNLSETDLAAYQAAFKVQNKYRTLRGFMIAQEIQKQQAL